MAQTLAECEKFKIARQFLKKHNLPVNLSNPQYDRCYCKFCYPADLADTYFVGGHTYVVPRGWTRFGVHVDEVIAKHYNIWESWANCYHGTSISSAKSVIEHRQLLLPGEETLDGKTISIRSGHIAGEVFFFTTPTIKYAELPCYASNYTFTATDKKKYKVKVVLQCKQKPNSITVQPETVRATKPICRFISNDKVEWKTRQRASIMPYGLLVKIEPVEPGTESVPRKVVATKNTLDNAGNVEEIEEDEEVDCPHCRHSNVWKMPSENEGIVITCKNKRCNQEFKVFSCPDCSQVNCLCACDDKFVTVAEIYCLNKRCKGTVVNQKCVHCSEFNIWAAPAKNKIERVTCSTNCENKSQIFNCPHCYVPKIIKRDFVYEGNYRICKSCTKKYTFIYCPKCDKLNPKPKKYCYVQIY